MALIRKLLQPTALGFLCLSIIASFVLNPTPAAPTTVINFLGEASLPTGFSFRKTELGGLSGITYEPNKNVYYAISDDRSEKAPARFYTLQINLDQGKLQDGSVKPLNVTTLLAQNNQPFTKLSIDAEAIALTERETVFVSSEVMPRG